MKHCFCMYIVFVMYRCGICNYVAGRNEIRLRLYVQGMWSVGFSWVTQICWDFLCTWLQYTHTHTQSHLHRTAHLLWALPLSYGKCLGTLWWIYTHTCSLSLSLTCCSRHTTKHDLSFFFCVKLFQGPLLTVFCIILFFPPKFTHNVSQGYVHRSSCKFVIFSSSFCSLN